MSWSSPVILSIYMHLLFVVHWSGIFMILTCLHIHVFHARYSRYSSTSTFTRQLNFLVNWLMHHAWDSALTCAVIFTQVAPFFYRITFLPTRTFEEQRRHAAWEQDAHVVCPVIRINQMHASQGWNARAVLSLFDQSCLYRNGKRSIR